MAKSPTSAPAVPSAVAAFLDRAARLPALRAVPSAEADPARLLFAVDATASRQPAWDAACAVQGEMFEAVGGTGRLAVSLAYWRGYGEFAATPWLTDPRDLARRMAEVSCLGGRTQVLRALDHALAEAGRVRRLGAVVLVGDAVEEAADPICHAAGALGARRVPVFCFQEGGDRAAEAVFRQVARLSGGAWAAFDARSPRTLADLLRAAAACARSGRAAVAALPGRAAASIAGQLPPPSPVSARPGSSAR